MSGTVTKTALSLLTAAALFMLTVAIAKALREDANTTFHVERINADGVACVAVKTGASVALSCNWPAAAPQWWQPQPEEPTP